MLPKEPSSASALVSSQPVEALISALAAVATVAATAALISMVRMISSSFFERLGTMGGNTNFAERARAVRLFDPSSLLKKVARTNNVFAKQFRT